MNRARDLRLIFALTAGSLLLSLMAGPWVQAAKKAGGRYSLERLDSAANLLLTVADGDRPGLCGIAPSEAQKLLNVLHPRIDEKRLARVQSLQTRKAGEAVADSRWVTDCARDCHCGIYADLLDSIGEERMSPSDRKIRDELMAQAKQLDSKGRLACAEKATWFCKSPLLSQLRAEAKGSR